MQVEQSWRSNLTPFDIAARAETFAKYPVVVIHFWGVWDFHDRVVDALLQELQVEYAGRIAFFSQDVDDKGGYPFCQECSVWNIPALVCFLNGEWHEVSVGVRSKQDFEAKLDRWIADSVAGG